MKQFKVSFDFDNTMSRRDVQGYARELIKKGYEVWIVTSRPHESYHNIDDWNDDLYNVAKELGIEKDRIKFMEYQAKALFLIPNNFLLHLDDDFYELIELKRSKVYGIQVESGGWKQKCERIIKMQENEKDNNSINYTFVGKL